MNAEWFNLSLQYIVQMTMYLGFYLHLIYYWNICHEKKTVRIGEGSGRSEK